jgi:hypothetical protein
MISSMAAPPIHVDGIPKYQPALPGGLEGRMAPLLELDTEFADQILAEKPAVRAIEARTGTAGGSRRSELWVVVRI